MNYHIGNILKETRKNAGLTLVELADKTGLSTSYISLLERGLNNPTLDSLHKVCLALNISMADLISEMNMPESIVVRKNERAIMYETNQTTYETLTNGKRFLSGIVINVDDDEVHVSEPHIVDEMGYVLDGSIIMTVNGVDYELHKDDCIYIDKGSDHSYRRIGTEPCVSLWTSITKINYRPELFNNKQQ